jgi:hypothetical protein
VLEVVCEGSVGSVDPVLLSALEDVFAVSEAVGVDVGTVVSVVDGESSVSDGSVTGVAGVAS